VVAGAVDPPLPTKLTPDVALSASEVLLATSEEVIAVVPRRFDRSGSNNPAADVGVGVTGSVVESVVEPLGVADPMLELVTSPSGPNKIPLEEEECVEDGDSVIAGASDEVEVVG